MAYRTKRRKNSKHRKHRSKARHRRHNPARRHRKSSHRVRARRHNPKRRSHSRRRHNPAATMRGFFDMSFITTALLGFGGFAIGVKTSSYVTKIPVIGTSSFSGLVQVLLGMVVFAKVRNQHVRGLAAGFALAGIYDVAAKNLTMLALPSLAGVDVMGDHGIDVDNDMSGDDDDMSGDDDDMDGAEVRGESHVTLLGSEVEGDGVTMLGTNGYAGGF